MIQSVQTLFLVSLTSVILACSLFSISKVQLHPSTNAPAGIYQLYSKWNLKYGNLRMSPSEDNFRLQQFHKSYLEVERLRKTQPTAQFGLNFLASITDNEFEQNYLNQELIDLNNKEEETLKETELEHKKLVQLTPPSLPEQNPKEFKNYDFTIIFPKLMQELRITVA